MTLLKNQTFVCIDCEATGLDTHNDRIIEIAITRFTFDEILMQYESLVDPEILIPPASTLIHHITDSMVQGQPKAQEILPSILEIIGNYPIVGHGINYDIELIANTATRLGIEHSLRKNMSIDTLRLARIYGESPVNSLEKLREHFNIEAEGAHRAMSDVIVNIQVFKKLSHGFKTLSDIREILSKPILMKTMPLGKHKGRSIKELPLDYLYWAAKQQFDQDLLHTLKAEIHRRKKGQSFSQSTNPFHSL